MISANDNIQARVEDTPSWWSPICSAIKEDTVNRVKEILETRKPDETCTCEKILSESPLHLAVLHGKEDVVDLLLSHDFDVSCTNLYGETPLHVACRTGNEAIVKMLLRAGSGLENKDSGECTPLFHAVYGNKPGVTELLIRAGSDLDTLNEELMSPLDYAVLYNFSDIITLLLKGGCALDKTMGLVYYPGHYSNSILFSLWTSGDFNSVHVLRNAGYRLSTSHLTTLFKVAKQLDWDDSLLHAAADLIKTPMSLKNSCRVSIRRRLMDVKFLKRKSMQHIIASLPLPSFLIDYVSMM